MGRWERDPIWTVIATYSPTTPPEVNAIATGAAATLANGPATNSQFMVFLPRMRQPDALALAPSDRVALLSEYEPGTIEAEASATRSSCRIDHGSRAGPSPTRFVYFVCGPLQSLYP